MTMQPQFHEGQEVEVAWMRSREYGEETPVWEPAKIVSIMERINLWPGPAFEVQFPDGTRSVFSAEHIRDPRRPRPETDASRASVPGPARASSPKIGKAMYEHAAKLAVLS